MNSGLIGFPAPKTATGPVGTARVYASGEVAPGVVVALGSDGMVSSVTTVSSSVGSEYTVAAAATTHVACTYDSANQKVVVAYADAANKGQCVVGTVTGSVISFGSPVEFKGSTTANISMVFDSTNNKVVIAYSNGTTNGEAIVGTVSGTSISFGVATTFNATNTTYISAVHIKGTSKTFIAYSDVADANKGYSVVMSLSGIALSAGSEVKFYDAACTYIATGYDQETGKVLVCYADSSDDGSAVIATISGTTITYGTPATFAASTTTRYIATAYDETNKKMLVAFWLLGGDGVAIIVNTSGATPMFSGQFTFHTGEADFIKMGVVQSTGKICLCFSDASTDVKATSGAYSDGVLVFPDLTGTAIAGVVTTSPMGLCIDSANGKAFIIYRDDGESFYGKATMFQPAYSTAQNWAGITNATTANGAPSFITVPGGVNDKLTGLTPGYTYYVTDAGALSAVPQGTGRKIGRAISTSELLLER